MVTMIEVEMTADISTIVDFHAYSADISSSINVSSAYHRGGVKK